MKAQCKNKRGITLVSLVVTIIILMILSGLTLTLIIGQSGIMGKAKEAKEVSTNADKSTAEGLNNLYNELVAGTGGETLGDLKGGSVLSATENVKIKDDNNNTVIIPAGFKISSDSATNVDNGIVIEDKDGNQFVWIPVASIEDYKRTDFPPPSYNYGAYSDYLETMPTDEKTSVTDNHGYYIGRYEAGDSISTSHKTFRTSDSSNNQVVIKSGQVPYNWVSPYGAKELAEEMSTIQKYMAKTKLCSSYAWDTAVNFIQKTISNYGSNSSQGNYRDTTFSYTDITGEKQIKGLNDVVIIPTGQTTPVCNIYDMGGNTWEWTTESCSGGYYAFRGSCVSNVNTGAGSRSRDTNISNLISFRISLYI